MLRFVRRCLSLLPYAISLGAVGYFLVERPFESDGIEDYFMRLGQKRGDSELSMILRGTVQDVTASRLGAHLLVCRLGQPAKQGLWTQDETQGYLIKVLVAGRCDAAVPKLAEIVEQFNRSHRPGDWREEVLSAEAIQALGDLGTRAADQALERLARDFQPFPQPYRAALPAYARRGKQAEVIAWAQAEIEALEALRAGDLEAARRRTALFAGLSALPAPEVTAFLWRLYDRRYSENPSAGIFPIWLRGERNHYDEVIRREELTRLIRERSPAVDFGRQVLGRMPEVSVISEDQFDHFVSILAPANGQDPGSVLLALESLRAEAGHDFPRVHWLKKAVALTAVAGTTTPADRPRLQQLQADASRIRITQALDWAQGLRSWRYEEAGTPRSPDWFPVRTESIRKLAARAESRIRSRDEVLAPVFCGFSAANRLAPAEAAEAVEETEDETPVAAPTPR